MIAFLAKTAAIGILGYCALNSAGHAKDQIENVTSLPKRVITLHELKQIHRLLQYDLVDASSRSIELSKFCAEELTAHGRDPGKDYWGTPYRLFYRGSLYDENSSVILSYSDADHMVVVSAAQDKKFQTKDDLTSKSSADEEVQELQKQIEAAATTAEKKKKS